MFFVFLLESTATMTLALLISALMCFILLAASTAEEEAAKTPGFVVI